MVNFDLRPFYLKDLTLSGATITPPGMFADLVGYISRGRNKTVAGGRFPLRDVSRAQEMFSAKKHVGNIAITMNG